jgi:MFS family permease
MMNDATQSARVELPRKTAVRFIVLLGIVSLFADMTYEGARSVTGPYLGMLGASAAVVGLVAGFGEFLGYALRLVSGYLSDRTGSYWLITIIGYGVNLLAVPLLALTGRWELAVLLIVAERAGKAIRTPARDAMLSHAGTQIGLGWGFGLHGALDQTGAILGPLIVGAALYLKGGYQGAFAILAIPAVLAMMVLFAARHFYPRPRDLDVAPPDLTPGPLPRRFWVYVSAAALIAAGYADFPLIAFHFGKTNLIAPVWIPAFYALAMAAEAMPALLLGRLFDRIGIGTMILATCASALSAPLAFLGDSKAALVGMVLWGVGMGAQGSVMRAAIAPFAPASERGTAYGIFNAAYGLAWFAGSSLLGVLYGRSVAAVAVASASLQIAAIIILWRIARRADGG